jgi:hypothetical protein
MAQHDYILANQSGAAFRSDLNNGLAAIVSNNSGVAQPSTTYAYQWWSDTTTGLLKLRNAANNAWITIGTLADANLGLLSLAGGTLTGALLVDDSGTAALPAIAFDGDTNTGIFSPGADQLAIATNGVERVEFGNAEVVFNDGGADVDFRVEGDTRPNLFKIDAGLDQVQVENLNGGPLAGFRNRIINGNFDIWQRGASFTASDYGADRWLHARVGTTQSATRQAFTLGQTDVPGEPTYFCRTVVSSVAGAGNFCLLAQPIEDVRTFAGQQITVSFWAKSDATKNIAVNMVQVFGTGGSPSANVGISGTKISVGTTFQKVTVTATLPSISGKTLGTNNNSALNLNIWFDAGSTYNGDTDSLGQQSGTFEIAQVQIEPGPVATPFEQRPIGAELALCQRYYEVIQDRDSVWINGTDYYDRGWQSFKVEKRAIPTVTILNPITLATSSVRNVNSSTDVPVVSSGPTISGVAFITTSGGGTNQVGRWKTLASAEL